ncbi:MAG TPA: hypothetical protein VGF20_14980 [Candidatus Acidoferrum sp.]|jgi:hypothetical protein
MNSAVSSPKTKGTLGNNLVRVTLTLSLTLLAATHAAAQYPGGGGGGTGTPGTPGYTPPAGGYGSGKAIGIGVGAGAAAGAGILYLALHNHGMVTGCVQPADDGLRLVDEKQKNKSYALLPGAVILKPGQRVELKGQKSKSDGEIQTFEAKKLVKDLGSCSAPTSVAQTQPAS